MHHIPEFLEKYKDVNVFNIQGLEKLNDFTTEYFFKSTNKNLTDNKYIEQLMNKKNRIDFYQLNLNFEKVLSPAN